MLTSEQARATSDSANAGALPLQPSSEGAADAARNNMPKGTRSPSPKKLLEEYEI